jgi:ABC-type enterochelin transport system substrate-binding protein
MKKTIYLLILAALILTACGSDNKQSNTSEESVEEMHMEGNEQAHDFNLLFLFSRMFNLVH